MPKVIDLETRELAIAFYLEGKVTIAEICGICNMSPTTFYRILKEENVQETLFTWMRRERR